MRLRIAVAVVVVVVVVVEEVVVCICICICVCVCVSAVRLRCARGTPCSRGYLQLDGCRLVVVEVVCSTMAVDWLYWGSSALWQTGCSGGLLCGRLVVVEVVCSVADWLWWNRWLCRGDVSSGGI